MVNTYQFLTTVTQLSLLLFQPLGSALKVDALIREFSLLEGHLLQFVGQLSLVVCEMALFDIKLLKLGDKRVFVVSNLLTIGEDLLLVMDESLLTLIELVLSGNKLCLRGLDVLLGDLDVLLGQCNSLPFSGKIIQVSLVLGLLDSEVLKILLQLSCCWVGTRRVVVVVVVVCVVGVAATTSTCVTVHNK